MPPQTNSRVILHKGKVFELFRENVTLDNGVTVDMDIVRHPGASAIVPIAHNNTVIMLKQYRHAIGDFLWEIPAGTLDADERPLQCAKRELKEETGFMAKQWRALGVITPLPGYADERIHIFLATELSPAAQNLDEDEILSVHEVGLDKAIDMIYTGTIRDGKTIAGLFMAAHKMIS
ncbi:MAG: NUDIX hydrolase [Deltaproteobacteria bacterium]|nr:NUDIX hydrolase [Deltaproteobacteria bacterium]